MTCELEANIDAATDTRILKCNLICSPRAQCQSKKQEETEINLLPLTIQLISDMKYVKERPVSL